MNTTCGKTWTRKFLTDILTSSFLTKTYKEHREKTFFEKEMALMPATQPVVEEQIRKEKIEAEVRLIEQQIKQLTTARNQLTHSIHNGQVAVERKEFIRRCGDSNCRGFLSTQWKCGLCEKWTCRDCHVVKAGEDHACLKDDVETAKLLAADTKGCPKCATLIFKISGCDQMWCTQCHTAFSWKTGRVESTIHNPHYYEWLRRSGAAPRNAGDLVQCGRELTHQFSSHIHTLVKTLRLETILYSRSSVIIRSILHMQEVELARYRVNNVVNNEKLRVDYMRNHIDEEKFKILVQREHTKFEKKREIYDVLTLLIQSSTDIMYRFVDELETLNRQKSISTRTPYVAPSDSKLWSILAEINPLVEYVNECLDTISNTYSSVTLEVNIPVDFANYHYNSVLTSRNKKAGKKVASGQAVATNQVIDLMNDD